MTLNTFTVEKGVFLALFSKRSNDSGGNSGFKRDPRKAGRFFEHAQTVADAHNYDYAIDLYINGLRHDPGNMEKHEALRDVALRRKVSGGKPAGFAEKLTDKIKVSGRSPIDNMLQAEKFWSLDPLNVGHMRDVMKHAVEADNREDELNLGEVAYWVGVMCLDLNAQAKNDKNINLDLRDLFAQIEAFDKAVEACKRALSKDPNNGRLLAELKDLEAENTMKAGGYSDGDKVGEGGFRKYIRDKAKQKALAEEDTINQTGSALDNTIARRRAEYEEDPSDIERLQKLVEVLIQKETDESENQAIELLEQARDTTGQYRFKMRIGDIRMKQMNRNIRQLKKQLAGKTGDRAMVQQYQEAAKHMLAFELQEYEERVKNYPTDMSLRFELGKRLYQSKKLDDAIGAFQQAKADPKYRSASHMYLGSCYLNKSWFDEAVDTLKQGLESHKFKDDKLAMDLQYLLMDALEQIARKNNDLEKAQEAREVASDILQTDINYRDIRERMDKLRNLVDELSRKQDS